MDIKSGINALFLKARAKVSQDNQRYINDGWNLDLTYVTPRVIAMGVPADGVTAAYRNPLTEIAAFLQNSHAGHFLVFNLSCIRYDYTKLDNRVVEYFFMDHHPPPFELLLCVVQAMRAFLAEHAENVVVVHCKAGRGRTGVVISSFLYSEGICKEPQEAVELFSLIRTSTPGCVEFQSQRRYVEYYSQALSNNLVYCIKPVILDRIICKKVPEVMFVGMTSWRQLPCIEVRSLATNTILFTTANDPACPIIQGDSLIFPVHKIISGDLLIRFFARAGSLLSSLLETETFRLCFNTFFLPSAHFVLTKNQIDFQPRDERFLDDFSVQIDTSAPPLPMASPSASRVIPAHADPPNQTSLAPLNISQSPSSPSCPAAIPPPPPPERAPPPPPPSEASPLNSFPPAPSRTIEAPSRPADLPRSPPIPVAFSPPTSYTQAALDIYQSFRPASIVQSPQTAMPLPPPIRPMYESAALPPSSSLSPPQSQLEVQHQPPQPLESSIVALDDEIAAYLEEEKNETMRIVG